MGLRITTWNVNGIRNPFGYQPWREKKTFQAMFDILEADIVIMQETKIQRKDLQDDMVLVPGWDAYFSLPKHKKGYSGVAIYTRSSVCSPIRAEEGITGILCPPGSSQSFFDLPNDERIGGYPTISQYGDCTLDAATLDSEGRCLILEFPAFVLIGTYCPANRDETRDHFRLGFLNVLDARIRNLVDAGKRVILAGDLNVIREELDTANAQERMRKEGVTAEEFFSTPARRLFNHLVEHGNVYGERDECRARPVLTDICRKFHNRRSGMFTCWDQKKNARPGNFGSRIDYICASLDCKDWFSESNIQEGLMGSDHCPVYAVISDKVQLDGRETDIRDVMNAVGMFQDGFRQRDWSIKDLLPASAKLLPEFDRRRNIRDMFTKMPPATPLIQEESLTGLATAGGEPRPESPTTGDGCGVVEVGLRDSFSTAPQPGVVKEQEGDTSSCNTGKKVNSMISKSKRSAELHLQRDQKRTKPASEKASTSKNRQRMAQSTLQGFFTPKTQTPGGQPNVNVNTQPSSSTGSNYSLSPYLRQGLTLGPDQDTQEDISSHNAGEGYNTPKEAKYLSTLVDVDKEGDIIDPIVAKESWSKILGTRIAPRCEHNEPCRMLSTKKPGMNCGRSFYICARPLGPSGEKERGTQWRCGTFIWSSEHTTSGQ
ncbi:Class II abasic (AP) endonuclease [Pseudogymnoascus verrucosus]|uniref:DNA-(apurinic or apyrimidinic site) endonuclease 2 n=1 Tax=Pseudogymnoascus verrucosus TaxID=342668 RepID=A0A1B8GTJ9_9PEZI|nr:Class II abasic (AP) endonuclease [Pseudogymnoascus verrucosus]OBT99159.1 Class II abasic (AP) endonuclease [Pseudogymnoascus verrucosus]